MQEKLREFCKPCFGGNRIKKLIALLMLTLLRPVQAEIIVFAASSTTDVMRELANAFKEENDEKIRFNFASSGTLARQIEEGAPVDVYISANTKWMDWLNEKESIIPASRFNFTANCLVLIAPPGSPLDFDGNIKGRVAVGNFKSVPAGSYAKEALTQMGWLEKLRPNLVMTSNARMVLMYVERGEVDAGIVYSTDAKASGKVQTIGIFPANSHSPINYPAAACSKKEMAFKFLEFLKTDKAKAILKKHGFTEPSC
jgi:molybdate transport system substrate-binding protein